MVGESELLKLKGKYIRIAHKGLGSTVEIIGNICPKCRKKLYEYEKKYNCVVDIGMNGCDGARGEKYILPHGERRIN